MLDIALLENVHASGNKVIARCPACAEEGDDQKGNHLFIAHNGTGPFGCVRYSGDFGKEHRKRIYRLAGTNSRNVVPARLTQTPAKPLSPVHLEGPRPLSLEELKTIARLRGWPYHHGLQLMSERGLLWFCQVEDDFRLWPAWVITDSKRFNIQARRLDGKPWVSMGAKAKSLRGSTASWPIGAADIGDRPVVLLCEGQPDFCAALAVARWEDIHDDAVAPVCMPGAGNHLHPESLRYFTGKRVRIICHADEAGFEAARRWAYQLVEGEAGLVDRASFGDLYRPDGEKVKDLADFATLLTDRTAPRHKVTAGLLEYTKNYNTKNLEK